MAAGLAGLIAAFTALARLPFEWPALKRLGLDFWPYLSGLAGLAFLFYFTLMDTCGTVGKRFLGLQLTDAADHPIRIPQSLSRAFISLLGLGCLGLPLIANIQGRFSGTKVVKSAGPF